MTIKNTEKDHKKHGNGSNRHYKHKKVAKISLMSILAVVALLLIFIAGYSITYARKVYSNVYLGEVNFGGMSKDEVNKELVLLSEKFLKDKFLLIYQAESGEETEYPISPNDIGLVFDTSSTTTEIFGYGRSGGAVSNLLSQIKSFFSSKRIGAEYSINQDALIKKVTEIADIVDLPELDYEITYKGEAKFLLSDQKQTGRRINQEELINSVKSQISNIKIVKKNFSSSLYEPRVLQSKAEEKLREANQILKEGDLGLIYSELNFVLDVDTIGGLVKSRPKGDDLELYIDKQKVLKQIEVIALEINREPQNAVLQVKDGQVSAFQLSQDGRKLDNEGSIIDIGNALLARATKGVKDIDIKKVTLKVVSTKPEITSDNLDNFGLKELVASGTTNFKGSPTNRVHNITVGANAINGTLIKPGEVFSTLEKLGEIDASGGYLPELVIKENRTVPEYGGGLCQVSTTLFRAALNSGMEILARSNHKYRVSYYEPPVGMDATIYDPAPDFKFKNNYDSHILVQATVVGTKITFDFYGTKDTRVVEVGNSEIYDIVEPGPPIEVTTDTLAPGERKQLEKAHQGASAKFHYKVAKEGNILQEKDFFSKYVAWPERWLVGITPEVAPAPETTPLESL